MTCKWLITMLMIRSIFLALWDPFPMAFLWLINRGDPNYLLSGVALQVFHHFRTYNVTFSEEKNAVGA